MGEGWKTDRWATASSDLSRKHAFYPAAVLGRHPGYGQRDLYAPQYHSHTETSPPLAVIAFSQGEVHVVLTVAGLVPTGEGAVKRGGLTVLDFGLVVLCHFADSQTHP